MINDSRKYIFIAVLIFVQYAQSASSPVAQVLDNIAQSSVMGIVDKRVVAPLLRSIQGPFLGTEAASPLYQDLVTEAQKDVVSKGRRRVGALKMSNRFPFAHVAAALSTPIGIFVNEDKVDKRSYGAQRSLLFHESEHTQNRDLTMFLSIGATSFVATTLVMNHFLASITGGTDATTVTLSLVGACFVAKHCLEKYQYYMEHRADLFGHKATACELCVRESGQDRYTTFEVEGNVLKDSGYLQCSQLFELADQMKEQRCLRHAQNNDMEK